jgi:hypothetical protein
MLSELISLISKSETAAFLIGAAIASLCGHAWRRFQERMITLRFSAQHTSLARSSNDLFGDTLQVLYRGEEVKALYVTEARIRNDSKTDLENVTVTLEYKNGEQYYGGSGSLEGNPNTVPFSSSFQIIVSRFLDRKSDEGPSPDLGYIQRIREFTIPVLNRGSSVVFNFLTHSDQTPYMYAVCVHKGVRVVEEKNSPKILGVSIGLAAFSGIAVGALLMAISYPFITSVGWGIIVAFLVGILATLIGAVFILLIKMILRLIS